MRLLISPHPYDHHPTVSPSLPATACPASACVVPTPHPTPSPSASSQPHRRHRKATCHPPHVLVLLHFLRSIPLPPLHLLAPHNPNSNRLAMAPVDTGDFLLDEDDDDFFVEYNPHPYRGGYDLAATFGTPLPPSANICYPVSSSAVTNVPTTPSPPSPTPEPEDPPPKKPYGDEEAPREPVYESPEVLPNAAATQGKARRRGRWWGRGFWKKCVRGLDYLLLMGYKDPYVEQRIGMDSYVVPVCANRKECGEDALAVEVELPPPSVGRVELHDASEKLVQSNDLYWHSNYRDDAATYSQSMSDLYYMPSFAQSYGLSGVLGKPYWFPNFSYTESHRVEEFQHEPLLSYDVEHKISGQPFHRYHHQRYKQPLNVQIESPGPFSSQRLGYYENLKFSTYCGQSDGHIFETPAYAYSIQSYASISDVPIEPFKPSWPQDWGLYDTNTHGDALENDTHSLISGEYEGIGSLFISPFYPRETETFERAPSDEHASFQHNWHNLSYQNVPMDDVSLIAQPADDSYSMNASFWPFGEHSSYSI